VPISSAPATWSCNMAMALLSLAIWSRPPLLTGFSLADTWAWLRYIPAISNASRLRLRPEWFDVDAHQKTILSDDFGVGCSTWWMRKHLGYKLFAETRHVVELLPPGLYELKSSARRGPRKSPDFMALGSRGLAIVECKGTQSNLQALDNAMDADHGQKQKKAFKVKSGWPPTDSLVVGMFIAQDASAEYSTLKVVDPEIRPHNNKVDPDAERLVSIAMMQIYLAKIFALLDQPTRSHAILSISARDALSIPGKQIDMLWTRKERFSNESTYVWSSIEVPQKRGQRASCRIDVPENVIESIIAAKSIGELCEAWIRQDVRAADKIMNDDHNTKMILPLGVRMELSIESDGI